MTQKIKALVKNSLVISDLQVISDVQDRIDNMFEDDLEERTRTAYAIAGGAITAYELLKPEGMYLSILPNLSLPQLGTFSVYNNTDQMVLKSVKRHIKDNNLDIAKNIIDREIKIDGAMLMAEHLYEIKICKDSEYLEWCVEDEDNVAADNFNVFYSCSMDFAIDLFQLLYADMDDEPAEQYFRDHMSELRSILENNWDKVEKIAQALLEKHTLDGDEYLQVLNIT